MQSTDNFKAREFHCRCCGKEKMYQHHVDRLQDFRTWYNRPMVINSGYRCEKHNKAVGGARQSQHKNGLATDFKLPKEFFTFNKKRKAQFLSNIKNKWFELCDEGGVAGGIGFYNTFIHLDSRKYRRAVWNKRK